MADKTPGNPEALKAIYLAARERLLNIITNTRGIGTRIYYRRILIQLEREIATLAAQSTKYTQTAVPEAYREGLADIDRYMHANNIPMSGVEVDSFGSIHTDTVDSMARELDYHISDGLRQAKGKIAGAVQKSVRQLSLEAAAETKAAGMTMRDMRNILLEKLKENGYMSVTYGKGERAYEVPLEEYVSMAARSVTIETGNRARINQLVENGYDLVQISTHWPTCDLCAALQGRVYSISGRDPRFPPLSEVFGKYTIIHPNCRHIVTPWMESLKTPEEIAEAIRISNARHDDPRDPAQREAYAKGQDNSRHNRELIAQYERYKAVLGDDCPDTLRKFRNAKEAGGEKWDMLQLDYRRRNELINHPERGLPLADQATAAPEKFEKYLFDPDHEIGGPKGVAFERRLGYNKDNWEELRAEILSRAPLYPTDGATATEYGFKYSQRMVLYGKTGKPTNVIVAWIYDGKGTRMTTAFTRKAKLSDGKN